MNTEQKIHWLTEKGYILDEILGYYRFVYENGNYRAGHMISVNEVISMDIDWLKYNHNTFISLAEKEHLF